MGLVIGIGLRGVEGSRDIVGLCEDLDVELGQAALVPG